MAHRVERLDPSLQLSHCSVPETHYYLIMVIARALKIARAHIGKVPLWRWGVFVPWCAAATWLLAQLLGQDILASGSWLLGILLGAGCTLSYGIAMWLVREASLQAAITLALVLFVALSVAAQYVFYDHARMQVREPLDEPHAGGWWDHLRAQAAQGLVAYERRPDSWRVTVLRQGWQLWLSWLVAHFAVLLGCLGAVLATLFTAPEPSGRGRSRDAPARPRVPDLPQPPASASSSPAEEYLGRWVTADGRVHVATYLPEQERVSVSSGPDDSGHAGHDSLGGSVALAELRDPDALHHWLEAVQASAATRKRLLELLARH